MIPEILDIAIKDIVTIDGNSTLQEAVSKMAESNTRTVVVKQDDSFKILTTTQLIDFKLHKVKKNSKLNALSLKSVKVIHKNLNLINVLNQIDSTDEYMIILNDQNKLEGLVSYTDIINNIDPQLLMEKQTLKSLISNYQALFINENNSVLDAIKLIRDSDAQAVVIENLQEKPVGIFTAKDFINLINLDKDLTKPISNYMSQPIETIKESSTIAQALEFIKKKRFKRLLVQNSHGKISGIISQKELLRLIYSKWIELIKEEGNKISKTNEQLIKTKNTLEEVASTDYLTKIFNRQKFESFLEYEINKQRRYNTEYFSLLLIDIDFFKNVNDTYGHLKGDMVLKEFAKILKLSLRDSDIVARWGGEEFVMLLPHTKINEAILVAEKIRSTVQRYDFKDDLKLTCSIGVSQFHENDTQREIFNRADNALYKAKTLSRNTVEIEIVE